MERSTNHGERQNELSKAREERDKERCFKLLWQGGNEGTHGTSPMPSASTIINLHNISDALEKVRLLPKGGERKRQSKTISYYKRSRDIMTDAFSYESATAV